MKLPSGWIVLAIVLSVAAIVLILLQIFIPSLFLSLRPGTSGPQVSPVPPGATATAAGTPSASLVAPSSPSYAELLEHFEKSATGLLDVAKLVILVVGSGTATAAIVAAYRGWTSRRDLDSVSRRTIELRTELKAEVEKLIQQVAEERKRTEDAVEKLIQQVAEERKRTEDATERVRCFIEARDPNSDVRLRAVQRLGQGHDIAGVSVLAEALKKADERVDIKLEAALGLELLLHGAVERATINQGAEALAKAIEDASDEVRRQAVKSLDAIVCSNVTLPATAQQALFKASQTETIADVRVAIQDTLEHIKKQREGAFKS